LALAALEKAKLVQLFNQIRYLKQDADFSQSLENQWYLRRLSAGLKMANGPIKEEQLITKDKDLKAHSVLSDYAFGFAWIMDRALLETIGFYDANIMGGGDTKFIQAAQGLGQDARKSRPMSDRHFQHYCEWAARTYQVVQGKIGAISGTVYHLWHGEMADRQYMPRHEILMSHDFDPRQDIALDQYGCWKWNSEKPLLHKAVSDFFKQRQEDGRPT
jgi:hypothetical protein